MAAFNLRGKPTDYTVSEVPLARGGVAYRVEAKPGSKIKFPATNIGDKQFTFSDLPWSVNDGEFVPAFPLPK